MYVAHVVLAAPSVVTKILKQWLLTLLYVCYNTNMYEHIATYINK